MTTPSIAYDSVRWFRYRTRCFGASYELLLAPAGARVNLMLPSPYVLSVAEQWDRVCTAGFDLTSMLVRTDEGLRATLGQDLAWRCSVVATERAATLTACARLRLDNLAIDQVRALRAALPRGSPTHSWLRYEQPLADYLAVADRANHQLPTIVTSTTKD